MPPSAYQKMKGVAKGASNSQAVSNTKEALGELITYTSTIVIALAINELTLTLFMKITNEDDGNIPLVILWIYAGIALLLAMLLCWITGESISFGEDIA